MDSPLPHDHRRELFADLIPQILANLVDGLEVAVNEPRSVLEDIIEVGFVFAPGSYDRSEFGQLRGL